MEFIESTHAKSNWALVGPDILDIFFDIDSSEVFVWYLIDIDHFCDTWNCFTPIIELTLFPIGVLNLLSRYSLSPTF